VLLLRNVQIDYVVDVIEFFF